MIRKIEGLLLSKIPFKERDLICRLLLRNGKKISVVFHGGQGGGKKRKSTFLEIGFMLQVELKKTKGGQNLYTAQEWSLKWSHSKIRTNYQAFYLLCLYMEVMDRISFAQDLHDALEGEDDSSEGLFRVASNGVYYLEHSLSLPSFSTSGQLTYYLGKLLQEQGIFPKGDQCLFCDDSIPQLPEVYFIPREGGFSCKECVGVEIGDPRSIQALGKKLWWELENLKRTQYKDLDHSRVMPKNFSQILFQYFCYQFQLEENSFKSWALNI